jgi:hypothetical protein
LSESPLWRLQERYFAEAGPDAWRSGTVPHYAVVNPAIADTYAELVFALRRDWGAGAGAASGPSEPLTICELGAGSGRFAYHFLRRLHLLCNEAGVSPAAFRYVLTDQAEANIEFWLGHPKFQPFFEAGLLDVAHRDATSTEQMKLRLVLIWMAGRSSALNVTTGEKTARIAGASVP